VTEDSSWELLRQALKGFSGGDIEWLEEGQDKTYRGPINTIALSEGGNRAQVTMGWCACTSVMDLTPKTWRATGSRAWLSFSKHTLVEATMSQNGQLDFTTQDKKGTFYPKGQNLSPRKVQGFGPRLQRVK
jgi:hypothetical protein